ncbi:MAG: diacylglycerol/lipid kinase family protein [Mucilaginibacter sp.]
MSYKHIHFIVNPTAGKRQAILPVINRIMDMEHIKWDISVITPRNSAHAIATKLINKTELIIVYGGDGSVCEVAGALRGTSTPMAILAGGTANVMAKELDMPDDPETALRLILSGQTEIKTIDMGMVNRRPFLLRVNLGIMADMVLQADNTLKQHLGQLAYAFATIKTMAATEPITYHMTIDGQKIVERGVSLTVTNCGGMGIGSLELQPDISMTDGLLDVLLLPDNDFTTLVQLAGSTLLQDETTAVKHWKCKQITITTAAIQHYICDDCEQTARRITIKVLPGAVNILVPNVNFSL